MGDLSVHNRHAGRGGTNNTPVHFRCIRCADGSFRADAMVRARGMVQDTPMSAFLSCWARRGAHAAQSLADALRLWLAADGLRMSAAMSFYGMLSLAPLLLLVVGLTGWWIDRSYVEQTLLVQVHAVMGERGVQVVQAALASAQQPAEGWLASLLGFVLLLSGATGVFVELQTALEKLWRMGASAPCVERAAWWRLVMLRLRGLAYVLALGGLLMVSMLLSTAVQLVTHWAGSVLPSFPLAPVVGLLNESVAFAIAVALFVGLMRLGSGPKPALRYLVFGAVVGALLFTLGKQGFAWYLSTAAVVSAYGAAGSIVALLMWIYFSSAILLLAAASAKSVSDARGRGSASRARPAAHAAENI